MTNAWESLTATDGRTDDLCPQCGAYWECECVPDPRDDLRVAMLEYAIEEIDNGIYQAWDAGRLNPPKYNVSLTGRET